MYAPGDDDGYVAVGRVASAESIRAYLDMNRLVTRHSAVVGSTGSGKSNAVANLLGAVSDQARFKSARVVLFDLHGSTQRPLAIKLGYLELEPMRPQVSMSCMFHFGHSRPKNSFQ